MLLFFADLLLGRVADSQTVPPQAITLDKRWLAVILSGFGPTTMWLSFARRRGRRLVIEDVTRAARLRWVLLDPVCGMLDPLWGAVRNLLFRQLELALPLGLPPCGLPDCVRASMDRWAPPLPPERFRPLVPPRAIVNRQTGLWEDDIIVHQVVQLGHVQSARWSFWSRCRLCTWRAPRAATSDCLIITRAIPTPLVL
jgi:hypothetical protein